MTYRPSRMRFGIFLAPFHRVGENPTVALDRDIELTEHLDRLNFDEAWFGEHHSAGWELIASPELMIAAAAQRTRTIRLGTGVSSLPYHHPFMLADRMVQLDHMTRGRAMFGVGPGALTSDAYMLGIDALTQRQRMDEALGVILRLFRGETVSMETDWFTMREARLQLAPYTHPHMPVAVASTFSPAGPVAAGKHGVGILSVAVSQPGGLISLAKTWEMAQDAACKAGQTISRDDWRLVIPIHLADSREEAIKDVAEGSFRFNKDYFEDTLGRPADPARRGGPDAPLAQDLQG
ncbi:MAG: LLM class flavin-dependent oxidoreductase, partial [Dehalococcoidia bacterium]|nr:LLM class flavin-dependent oxidoreductase [Dehalococcoidia bacterium]